MKNVVDRTTFNDRRTTPLPDDEVAVYIIYKDVEGEEVLLCLWKPYRPADYTEKTQPGTGYLGTCWLVDTTRIGFNAWAQNEYEFVYWKLA